MAILKKTWNQLIEQNSPASIITGVISDLENIDTLLNEKSEGISGSYLKDLANHVKTALLSQNGIWKNLPIFVSSYKFEDKRIIHLISNKLREYVLFYEKLVTDEGVSRNLSYAKEYANSGSASNVERGTQSETPQNSNLYDSEHPESDSLFDEAIADFASNINKNKSSQASSSEGSSTTLVTGGTWEEQKKSIELMFFNELKEYIVSIPERIYSWYSIDTVPFTELKVMEAEYLKDLAELLKSYE